MQNSGKVNNTTIWWPKKTDETNRFKLKTWRWFNIAILKVKQIHYKWIEVFTIRFNPKSIATSSSNLLIWPYASFESWICSTQAPMLVTLRSHSKVSDHALLIFATTRFYQHLIVDLVLIDACRVRRYRTSQISQE